MYVVAHVSTSFLFTAKNITFYDYTTFYFLFFSSYTIEFFPWIKMLQTFMYTCFYSNICFSSLGICLRGELLGHMVILCLKFWGIAKQIFTWLYYFTHLPAMCKGSNFSYLCQYLLFFSFCPLDCKAIQLVHPKQDQSWVFIGKTDAEAETTILWPWYEELTYWKRPWFWEELGAGGDGDDRGWDGWMASPARCTWVWVNFGSWWWTGRPGILRFMGWQKVGHDWVTELNWTELINQVEKNV